METSEFIDIIPEFPVTFKRAVSVKLPLPAGFEETEEKKVKRVGLINSLFLININIWLLFLLLSVLFILFVLYANLSRHTGNCIIFPALSM